MQQGLEDLWAQGLQKSEWEFKKHTLEYVSTLVNRIPREFSRKSEFLAEKIPPPPPVEAIEQEPSRDWCSLLAIPACEKTRAVALENFSKGMELTPGWVCIYPSIQP